ncbi:hypothetical protein BFJ70_g1746 [Fusarium oxysporum]|nr:hypothetical protein BFJ70_g1746 [Fusarium oxysporum]
MDEPNDHAIALSMAQAVEADAELIATLIREEEQARRDFELARQLEQNPDAIPEAGDGADHSGLDDETYRTLQAFNVAAQQGESTGVEAELSHEETHEASSVAGGDGTGVESATGDDSQNDADNQSYDTAPRDDVSQRDEGEIQGEEIKPEETQEEGDADYQPETTQVASPAPSELYVETKECLYCSDEFPIDMIFEAPCSHAMCQPCLIRSIRTAIKDESLFPPKCCGQAIPVDTTNTFIPEELLTKCDNKREEYETTNRTYCSDKACSEFIPLRTIEAGIARCTRCETRTCLNCLSEAHEGTCTDDPESQRVIRLAEEHGWRRCEQCKNMVELTHGYFHISCRCGHQFCYLCGRQWKTCNCPQWDERRLMARAGELAAARARVPAPAPAPVARPVQPVGCRHRNYRPFDRVEGEDECNDCGSEMRQYIFSCPNCELVLCRRCLEARRNQRG